MKTCITAACCAAALGVCAENEIAETLSKTNRQIVVTATRIETPIDQTGSSINVVDQEQLIRQQPKNAHSALKQTSGTQAIQSGGPGTASSVFIRGANANHTLVLINGVRVNSNTTGDFNLSTLPTESIERIEILKGSQSALYGADAIGGVVNIITKKGAVKPLGGSASVAIGEKGYREEIITLSGGDEIADFMSSISYSELNEFDIAEHKNNDGKEDDPTRRLSVYNNVGLNFADDGRADLTVLYNRNQTEIDNLASWPNYWQVDDPDRDTETEQWLTALAVSKPLTERYTQTVRASYTEEETTGRNNGTEEYFFKSRNYGAGAQSDFRILENDTLSAGYEFRRFEAENSGSYDAESTDQNSVYLSNQLNLYERLFLTLGGRYDHYSDFDSEVTWNAAASWFALENTRLHGSIGTGYKAPTMNDLYWPAGFWSAGNPDLEPESSRFFDIGVEQTLLDGKLIADATYFKSQITDMIVWAETAPWFWQPSNVNEAEIQGVELSLTAKPTDDLSAKTWFTLTDTEDTGTGNELARRARHTAGFSANWDYSTRGSIYAGCTYTGTRFDDAANTRTLARFVTVDIGTRYQLTDHLSLFAHVDNLFNKQYETAAGYGTIGRLASVGVKGEF